MRAYRFDWKKFENWLADESGYSLPQDHDQIALHVGMFLSDMAKTGNFNITAWLLIMQLVKHYISETMMNMKLDHFALKKAIKGVHNDLKQPFIKKKAIKTELNHFSLLLTAGIFSVYA